MPFVGEMVQISNIESNANSDMSLAEYHIRFSSRYYGSRVFCDMAEYQMRG